MGYAMDDRICADCTMLHQAARDAIMQHVYAESRLAIVKLQYDGPKIRVLEPVVQRLLQARSAAVRTYQEHVHTHAQEAMHAEEAAIATMTVQHSPRFSI
jgi:hypothetical protein